MAYVLIKQGENMKTDDRKPELVLRLFKENNNPEDLSSVNDVAVYIGEANTDTLTVDDDTAGNVAISDATSGEITYSWAAGDTESPGTYVGEVEVDFGAETKTFPSSGTFSIFVEEALK